MRYNPAGKIDVPFRPDYLFPGGLQTLFFIPNIPSKLYLKICNMRLCQTCERFFF